MPVHDWTRVGAGAFHDFHCGWIVAIRSALNDGILPPDYYAMAEQVAGEDTPDGLALEADRYAEMRRFVVIRHTGDDRVIARIEILSPGHKTSRAPTAASYPTEWPETACIELVTIGDSLPDMPLFLDPASYVSVPLEATYETAWRGLPQRWRDVLQAAS